MKINFFLKTGIQTWVKAKQDLLTGRAWKLLLAFLTNIFLNGSDKLGYEHELIVLNNNDDLFYFEIKFRWKPKNNLSISTAVTFTSDTLQAVARRQYAGGSEYDIGY